MFLKKRAPKTSVVGLELDPGHLAAAEVAANGSIITLTRGAVAPLRVGILRDGEVADVAGLAQALKGLFEENDLPKRVRLGVANQRIVVRSLDLMPAEDEKQLAALVRAEAPDHIPMPMNEAIVDFQPVGIVQTLAGPRQRVVVVAVRREMIERVLAATSEAGLTVEGVDLSAFGMVRALAGPEASGAQLYVNVAGLTNVAVANPTGCLFTRAAAGGLDAMVHNLAERRGLTVEHATQWLTHVGLVAPVDSLEGDPDLLAATRTVLEEGVHQLADTVRNSLNFYRMQEHAEQVDGGVVTGPAVAIAGLVEKLSEHLRLPLQAGIVAAGDDASDVERLTVAAGLAVAARP
ncbi:MAG: pilus assembly protein PilM [Solirubrobacteraceae bacterium]